MGQHARSHAPAVLPEPAGIAGQSQRLALPYPKPPSQRWALGGNGGVSSKHPKKTPPQGLSPLGAENQLEPDFGWMWMRQTFICPQTRMWVQPLEQHKKSGRECEAGWGWGVPPLGGRAFV